MRFGSGGIQALPVNWLSRLMSKVRAPSFIPYSQICRAHRMMTGQGICVRPLVKLGSSQSAGLVVVNGKLCGLPRSDMLQTSMLYLGPNYLSWSEETCSKHPHCIQDLSIWVDRGLCAPNVWAISRTRVFRLIGGDVFRTSALYPGSEYSGWSRVMCSKRPSYIQYPSTWVDQGWCARNVHAIFRTWVFGWSGVTCSECSHYI